MSHLDYWAEHWFSTERAVHGLHILCRGTVWLQRRLHGTGLEIEAWRPRARARTGPAWRIFRKPPAPRPWCAPGASSPAGGPQVQQLYEIG